MPAVLETKNLILRPMRPEDAPAHFKHINDWEVARYLAPQFPWPYPESGSEKFIAAYKDDGDNITWAITRKGEDEMIGVIELRLKREEGQRGFWLGRAFHGQGLMTEAIMTTNDYWFNVLGKPSLHVINAQTNKASSRLKEKTGARFLGTRPGKFLDPSFNTEELWETSAEDWRAFRKKLAIDPAITPKQRL